MRKISLLLFFVMSFPSLVFSSPVMVESKGDSDLPKGVTIKKDAIVLVNEMFILDRERHLDSRIINVLEKDLFTKITIEGKKMHLGHTMDDIARLRLKNLKELDLDLFYGQFEIPESKQYLQDLLKEVYPGLNIRMRMNDLLLDEFSL